MLECNDPKSVTPAPLFCLRRGSRRYSRSRRLKVSLGSAGSSTCCSLRNSGALPIRGGRLFQAAGLFEEELLQLRCLGAIEGAEPQITGDGSLRSLGTSPRGRPTRHRHLPGQRPLAGWLPAITSPSSLASWGKASAFKSDSNRAPFALRFTRCTIAATLATQCAAASFNAKHLIRLYAVAITHPLNAAQSQNISYVKKVQKGQMDNAQD
jgi:hypothetical protein